MMIRRPRLNPYAFSLVLFGFTSALVVVSFYRNGRQNNVENDHNPIENCHSTTANWENYFETDTLLTGPQVIDYFLWTNQSSCKLAHYFGGYVRLDPSAKDGIKPVCLDPEVAPNPKDCLVYSFGIGNDWSFDDDMEYYGCDVFSFDPSINKKSHERTFAIHFYDWGLSHQNGKGVGEQSHWEMRTLSSIYEELTKRHGHKIIDYLKLDIEFSEWDVIPDMIDSGMLSKVRQLGIELHVSPDESIEKYNHYARIVRSLENHGMVRFDSKYNPWLVQRFPHLNLTASSGYDISWFNSKLVQKAKKTQ